MRFVSMVLAALTLLAACEQDPAPSGATTSNATTSSTSSAAPSSTTTASATASAAPAHPHAGTWKGSFEATKGDVTIEEGVPYGTWKKEEGASLAGAGEIVLTVSPNGAVNGKATGALGALRAMGVLAAEDSELAVTLQPEDPNAEDAMTGTLVGKVEGDLIKGELRASSRDGNRVRKASLTLERLR